MCDQYHPEWASGTVERSELGNSVPELIAERPLRAPLSPQLTDPRFPWAGHCPFYPVKLAPFLYPHELDPPMGHICFFQSLTHAILSNLKCLAFKGHRYARLIDIQYRGGAPPPWAPSSL